MLHDLKPIPASLPSTACKMHTCLGPAYSHNASATVQHTSGWTILAAGPLHQQHEGPGTPHIQLCAGWQVCLVDVQCTSPPTGTTPQCSAVWRPSP
jgi:hypothetical protein